MLSNDASPDSVPLYYKDLSVRTSLEMTRSDLFNDASLSLLLFGNMSASP